MAKDLDVKQQELLALILEFVTGEQLTLDDFNAVAQCVKKEYSSRVIL